MGFKDPDQGDRLKAAQAAKKAALQKFLAQPKPGDPEFVAREQERLAIVAARAERQAAKEALAAEKAAQLERERELAAIALQEDLDRKDRERAEQDERDRMLEAEKKAERDAKYAARKARGKKRG
jgi:hypothetical protein